MHVIAVFDGTEPRLPLRELQDLLQPGDTLTVCDAREYDVVFVDKRPVPSAESPMKRS